MGKDWGVGNRDTRRLRLCGRRIGMGKCRIWVRVRDARGFGWGGRWGGEGGDSGGVNERGRE